MDIAENAARSRVQDIFQVRCNFYLEHFAHYYGKEIAAKNPNDYAICQTTTERVFEAIEKWQSSPKSGLILAGNAGNGKTTIARAIFLAAQRYAEQNFTGAEKARNLPAWATAKQVVGVVEAGKDDVYSRFEAKQILFIDDFGEEATDANRFGNIKTPMIDLLEERYFRKSATIITTNLSMEAIKEKYGARVEDRLKEMCAVIGFNEKSFRK